MKLKRIFFLLFLIGLIKFNEKIYSQKDSIKLHLKEYHSAQITDILVTKDKKRILTIDNSGKILIYNTDDFSYRSTLKERNNFLIESPRFIFDGKGLFFKSKDSLWILDGTGKVLAKNLFKGTVISNKKSPFTIVSENNARAMSFFVSIFNDKFKLYSSFKTSKKVKVATINKDSTHIAYVEQNYAGNQNLVYRDLQNNQVLWERKVEDKNKIVYPFFNDESNTLHTITVNTEENFLSVFAYKNGKRATKPEVKITWLSTIFTTSIIDRFLDKKSIVITDKNTFPQSPVILNLKNNRFTLNEIKIKEGAYAGAFISDTKLVTSNVFNTYNSIANFTVSDINQRKKLNSYPNFSQKFYEGVFLPDDSFLVYGSALKKSNFLDNYELQLKYFNQGTFNNQFNTLSFKDYLEVNHKISFYFMDHFFDKKTGLILFRGSDLNTNQSYIFKYSFIEDKVTKLYKIKDKYFSIIDFDATSNKLLLSPKKYFNRGHTAPQPLALVENNTIKEFTGLYKFAKFSEGAKHILTINEESLVQIRSDLKTILLEEQLKKSEYLLHKADDGFIVSYSYFSDEKYVFEDESIFFALNDDNRFKSETKPFIYINNLDYKNDKIALVIKNIGVIVGEKRIENDYLEPVKSVSLNKDASKLMITYANGKISIVDTETLKEVGGMFHPTEKEHVFYDAKNHYFSNTNADDFLFVTKGDKKVTLKSVDKDLFKPEEVLNVFSSPNQEYLTLLKKATLLRNENSFVEENSTTELKDTNKQGNLYVLSVGVSKYQDEAYNLTFADKDAFDIASLYGKLDAVTIAKFKKEFLGNNYTLQSPKDKNIASLKRYEETYTSVGDMYAIDSNRKIWLEINYDDAFIWNFDVKKIEKINLPKDFKKSISFSKQIFTSPKKSEFYIRSNGSNFYKLNFLTKKVEKINLPFEFKYNDYENYKSIEGDRWMYLTQLNTRNEFQVLSATKNKSKIDTTVYKLNTYLSLKDTIHLESYDNLRPNFKSISSSGKFALFRDVSDNAYQIKLSKGKIPTKMPFKIKYGDEVSMSEDGKEITVLSSVLGEFRYKTITYNLDGKVLDSLTFIDKEYNIKGFSIANAAPKWIKSNSAMISDYNYGGFSSFNLLSKATPFSFNKTYVKKITNTEATKQNIESEISDFLKDTKQEDQVILFIAGHGVLDKNNNYYYAPYNMDFDDVAKNGVAFKTIINGLSNTKAINKLLLMDTCHAGNTLDLEASKETSRESSTRTEEGKRGTITKSDRKTPKFKVSDIVSTLFDDFLSKSGVTILSASSGGDVAYENKDLSNGAFTSAYLKILKSKMGTYGVTEDGIKKTIPLTEDFISEVLKEVMLLTKGKQVPDIREVNKNVIIKAW